MNVDISSRYKAMNLSQIANKYKVTCKVLNSWLETYLPDLVRPTGTYTYPPAEVKRIVDACGEFPE